MRTLLASFALLPIFTATATASVQESTPALRERFNQAVEQLREAAVARNASRADYQRVLDALTESTKAYQAETPHALSTRERLAERVRELETMARTAALEAGEFDILKDQAIDVELEYTLARLEARALAGNATREEYQAVANALTARADAAKSWNPEIAAIATRLRAEVDKLMERAKESRPKKEDFEPTRDLLTEIRASIVITRLQMRAVEKKAIEADYRDVASVIDRMPGDGLEELREKVQARLTELRDAVRAGRITREDFASLRTLIMNRAREASAPK